VTSRDRMILLETHPLILGDLGIYFNVTMRQ